MSTPTSPPAASHSRVSSRSPTGAGAPTSRRDGRVDDVRAHLDRRRRDHHALADGHRHDRAGHDGRARRLARRRHLDDAALDDGHLKRGLVLPANPHARMRPIAGRELLERAFSRVGAAQRRALVAGSGGPAAADGGAGPLHRAWTGYVSALEANPVQVKVASAAVIFSTGDFATQTVLERTDVRRVDVKRTARMAAFGCCVTAWVHCWWGVLEPFAASAFCPQTQRLKNTVVKVLCDQSFGAGSFNLIFFSQTALIEGCGVHGAAERADAMVAAGSGTGASALVRELLLRPFHLRVLWQNLALVGWSALLSTSGPQRARRVPLIPRASSERSGDHARRPLEGGGGGLP